MLISVLLFSCFINVFVISGLLKFVVFYDVDMSEFVVMSVVLWKCLLYVMSDSV